MVTPRMSMRIAVVSPTPGIAAAVCQLLVPFQSSALNAADGATFLYVITAFAVTSASPTLTVTFGPAASFIWNSDALPVVVSRFPVSPTCGSLSINTKFCSALALSFVTSKVYVALSPIDGVVT